jgi:hypothetical protein
MLKLLFSSYWFIIYYSLLDRRTGKSFWWHRIVVNRSLLRKSAVIGHSLRAMPPTYIQGRNSWSTGLLWQIIQYLERKQTTFTIYKMFILYMKSPFLSPANYSLFAYIKARHSHSICLLFTILYGASNRANNFFSSMNCSFYR